jgi:hypothetical protein
MWNLNEPPVRVLLKLVKKMLAQVFLKAAAKVFITAHFNWWVNPFIRFLELNFFHLPG